MTAPQHTHGTDWFEPQLEESALERYLQVLRERWKLILACVLLSLAAAAAYVATADRVYQASSDLVVQPIEAGDEAYVGLGLLNDSGDATADLETVARLVETTDVARTVQRRLRLDGSPGDLLADVEAEPVAGSRILAITASAGDPEDAQRLANAFAEGVVQNRDDSLTQQIDVVLRDLRQRASELAGQPESSVRAAQEAELVTQITALERLRSTGDPTVRVANAAELPTAAVSPRPVLSIAAGLLVGLILGLTGAFALQVLDPRLRREEQLRRLTRLSILGRIPKDRSARKGRPLRPERLSPGTIEAYRTLRATLSATRRARPGESRSILITGPSASEGKSTTAINLAASLAVAGHSVILIEADLRRPSIGRALDVRPQHDIMDVLLERVDLEQALVSSESFGANLQLLLAKPVEGNAVLGDGLFLPTAQRLVDDAKQLADYVIIDSPPLTEVIDGLALAERADDVLLVVRLGRSHMTKISQLGELLARQGIEPAGFALIGLPASQATSEYYVGTRAPGRSVAAGSR